MAVLYTDQMLPLADAVVGKLDMESDLNSDHIIHTPSIVRAIHATNTTGVANRDTTEAASNSSATLGENRRDLSKSSNGVNVLAICKENAYLPCTLFFNIL